MHFHSAVLNQVGDNSGVQYPDFCARGWAWNHQQSIKREGCIVCFCLGLDKKIGCW